MKFTYGCPKCGKEGGLHRGWFSSAHRCRKCGKSWTPSQKEGYWLLRWEHKRSSGSTKFSEQKVRDCERCGGKLSVYFQDAFATSAKVLLEVCRACGHEKWNAAGRAASRIKLLEAAINAGDKSAVEKLLHKHPEVIYAKGELGATGLNTAAARGNKGIVESFIAHGADVNAADMAGLTPLHVAAVAMLMGDGNCVQVLLANGANVEAKNMGGETPLALVSKGPANQLSLAVRKLLAKRPPVKAAAPEETSEIARLMREKGSAATMDEIARAMEASPRKSMRMTQKQADLIKGAFKPIQAMMTASLLTNKNKSVRVVGAAILRAVAAAIGREQLLDMVGPLGKEVRKVLDETGGIWPFVPG